MSYQIVQPVNQVRLTNVAVVRMSYHGKRFEVACYRNKILNYRQKIETDLSEVLQTDRVFTNVSKGLIAPSKDLLKAFNSTDQEEICRIILDKGQIQVSDMERNATLENTAKEIANYIATKCVHSISNRPYTVHQIRDAMKKAEISVQPTTARSVKQQFLDCVRLIQQKNILDIQRAKMELAIVFPQSTLETENGHENDDELIEDVVILLKEDAKAIVEIIHGHERIQFLIDPSQYRVVDNITKQIKGAKLEILRQTVTQEGDVDVTKELERNTLIQQSRENNQPKSDQQAATNIEKMAQTNASTLHANFQQLELKNNTERVENGSEENDTDDEVIATTRKKNKKAAKKSKKAKRREKEEASIRQERVEAEKSRQIERNFRLGLDSQGKKPESVECANPEKGDEGGLKKTCNTCGGSFNPSQYRSHFRSDWHRYNMKLKMKGIAPVEENEFLLIDSDAFFN